MRESIAAMWDAFTIAVIRFWDNRFVIDDETDFLRRQIESLFSENRRLVNLLIDIEPRNDAVGGNTFIKEHQPVAGKQFVPWSIKRQQLEKDSIDKLEREVLLRNNLAKSNSLDEVS